MGPDSLHWLKEFQRQQLIEQESSQLLQKSSGQHYLVMVEESLMHATKIANAPAEASIRGSVLVSSETATICLRRNRGSKVFGTEGSNSEVSLSTIVAEVENAFLCVTSTTNTSTSTSTSSSGGGDSGGDLPGSLLSPSSSALKTAVKTQTSASSCLSIASLIYAHNYYGQLMTQPEKGEGDEAAGRDVRVSAGTATQILVHIQITVVHHNFS